jgi:integrase
MRVKIVPHPSGELLPILLNEEGFPICLPNEFILGRRALALNTLVRNLRELAVLYRWTTYTQLELPKLISDKTSLNEALIRGSMIEFLRKDQSREDLAVSPHTFNQRLTTVRQYLSWLFDIQLSELSSPDSEYDSVLMRKRQLLRWVDSCFINAPPSIRNIRKGLSDPEVSSLISLLYPRGKDILKREEAVRHRNYVMTMIMLSLGLRPGELLSLKVEDVEIGAISTIRVIRRLSDKSDVRRPRPQIKRNSRIVPIVDQSFAKELDDYILIWRERLGDRAEADTEYLILSDEGKPLSQSSVTQFYQILRVKYSSMLPKNLSAKSLRHTFSSRMERNLRESGVDEARRIKVLATLRGDSSLESQSVYIDQEIEQLARKALDSYHRKIFTEGRNE